MQDIHGDEHKYKICLIVARNKLSHKNTNKGKAVEVNGGLEIWTMKDVLETVIDAFLFGITRGTEMKHLNETWPFVYYWMHLLDSPKNAAISASEAESHTADYKNGILLIPTIVIIKCLVSSWQNALKTDVTWDRKPCY